MQPDLRTMLLQSEVAILQERVAQISIATRARLAEAACELRQEADCEGFGRDSDLAKAAHRLECLAHADMPRPF
jgi:hypothetical protein